MTIPAPLDTQLWAERQEQVIAGAPVSSLFQFEPLCRLQESLTPTNLTIRQNALMGRADKATKQAKSLSRDGLWLEGPDYASYANAAFPVDVQAYRKFVAPDQTYPFPEAYSTTYEVPLDEQPNTVSTPTMFCKRWFNPDRTVITRYILIFLDENPEPKLNFHHWPTFGHYVLWENGYWIKAPHRYTGWPSHQKILLDENKYLHAPKGPWNGPAWRVTSSTTKVLTRSESKISIQYGGKFLGLIGSKTIRTFTINPNGVTVADKEC